MTVVKRGRTVLQCEAEVDPVAYGDGIHWQACTEQDCCCCCLTGPTGCLCICCYYDRGRPPSGYYRPKKNTPKRMGFRGPLGSGIVKSLGSRGEKPCAPVRPCVLESGVDTSVGCTQFRAGGAMVQISVSKLLMLKNLFWNNIILDRNYFVFIVGC